MEFQAKPKRPKCGKFNIKDFVIRRCKPKRHIFKCPVCIKKDKTQGEQNVHIKKKHPNFRFLCKHCDKKYQTFNAKWKHESAHKTFKYKCPYKGCKSRFQFPKDLREHEPKHTGEKSTLTHIVGHNTIAYEL